MRVLLTKENEKNVDLGLDETGEFKQLKIRQYTLILDSEKEYVQIEPDIKNAILDNIEVHHYSPNTSKLSIYKNKLLMCRFNVIILNTYDENKFGMLDDYVKNMMQEIKLLTEE